MGERTVAAPTAGELIAQQVADRIRDLTQLPLVMQGAGVVAIQADLQAAIDLALASAEQERGAVPEISEKSGSGDERDALIERGWERINGLVRELRAKADAFRAEARYANPNRLDSLHGAARMADEDADAVSAVLRETATLTERLARAEADSKRIGEVEHRGWAIVPLAVGGYSVVEFTKSGCHEVASGMGPLRDTIDTALRAAAGGRK